MAAGVLLYDADCAFCTRAAAWLLRRRPGCAVEALQVQDLAGLGVDPQRATREIAFVGADGRVFWAAEAIGQAVASCPGLTGFAGRLLSNSAVRWVAERAYRLIARNRHRLPGGSGACRLS